jgi:hypothetical protein
MPMEVLRRPSSSRARLVTGMTGVAEWWVLLGCLLAVALPALMIALAALWARPDVHPGADQALIEIGTGNAAKLNQELGPYSRFGWSHPGPSWYYLLAPLYRLFGEHSWAMTVAVAAFQAAAAAAIVLTVRRFGARWLSVAAVAVVLAYVGSLPAEVWRAAWNPYALLLPAGLLVVLSAGAAAGSRVAVVGALLCGSFLIQTHIGTTPLVLAMWVGSAVLRVARSRQRTTFSHHGRPSAQTTRRRERGWLVLGAVGLAGMWFPPLWQQLTAPMGNLSAVAEFFTAPSEPGHPWRASVSALGRELAVFPLGRNNAGLPSDIARLPLSVVAVVVGYAALALGLVVVAWRSDRFLAALGTLCLIALPVSAFSVGRIVGEVDDYLVLWQSVLPMVVWLGWTGVLLRPLVGRWTDRGRRLTAGFVGVALGVLAGVDARRGTDLPPLSSAASATGVAQASGALTDPAVVRGPVLVRIETQSTWTLAAGIVLDLRKRGADPAVTDDWVFLFGDQMRSRRPRYVEVIVASEPDANRMPASAARVAEVTTAQGPATVLVRRSTVPLSSGSSTVAGLS